MVIQKGQSKLNNPEKLAAYDTKDEEKQSITQHIRGENLFMQTNTNKLKTKEKIPLNVDSIIWYNSSLKIEGKTLFYKELFDNNIIFIKDILDEENKFKTYDELKNQLNCKLNFLKYFSLISMIKSKNLS